MKVTCVGNEPVPQPPPIASVLVMLTVQEAGLLRALMNRLVDFKGEMDQLIGKLRYSLREAGVPRPSVNWESIGGDVCSPEIPDCPGR